MRDIREDINFFIVIVKNDMNDDSLILNYTYLHADKIDHNENTLLRSS